MKSKITTLIYKGTIGLVYDVPEKLKNSTHILFPDDASSEWETKKTIDTIEKTWKQLGFQVILFPINQCFLADWERRSSECTLIHSLVEGFGSLSREAWIPSLCELSGIPFIGSSPLAHTICMSKYLTKIVCDRLKIPTPSYYIVKQESDLQLIPNDFFKSYHFIKPDGEGSGMGIDASYSISNSKEKSLIIIKNLLYKYNDGILLEEYLQGPEFTSALIGTPPMFLPIAQIDVGDSGVYGYAFKRKEKMEEKISFPVLSKKILHTVEEGSRKLFEFLNMKDFVRMDWKCDLDGRIYFLEANTLAGLSYHYSVLPIMYMNLGYQYSDLLELLAHSALSRSNSKNLWYGKTRVKK